MPRDTEVAYSLREKLGSESAGKWLEFMDFIESSLPFILRGAGRPTTEEIASSAIGRGGFTSWREMIESSPAWGGLGWSYDTYKAWKKAFSLVQQYPYLRDLALSSSEINTIRRENKEFPASLEAFQGTKEKRKDAQEERRQNSVASLQKQVSASEKEAASLQHQLDISRASEAQNKSLLSQLRQELSQSSEKTGSLLVQVEQLNTTLTKQKSKIERQGKKIEELESSVFSTKSANRRIADYLFKHVFDVSRWILFKAFLQGTIRTPPKDVSQILRDAKRKS